MSIVRVLCGVDEKIVRWIDQARDSRIRKVVADLYQCGWEHLVVGWQPVHPYRPPWGRGSVCHSIAARTKAGRAKRLRAVCMHAAFE